MKKTLLIYLALLLTSTIFGQDVCDELMKFNDYKKNVNRTYRMKSTTEGIGQSVTMECDGKGKIHQWMTMEMGGQSMKMESVIVDNTMYMNQNETGWQTQKLDSAQMQSIKSQWENNQLQFFKNCQKLENETVDGKKYRVYRGEYDGKKMLEMMGESAKNMPNAEMMSKMEMKMTFYINDKNDVEITKMKMDMQGRIISTEMVYEYDLPITVNIPQLPAEKKD